MEAENDGFGITMDLSNGIDGETKVIGIGLFQIQRAILCMLQRFFPGKAAIAQRLVYCGGLPFWEFWCPISRISAELLHLNWPDVIPGFPGYLWMSWILFPFGCGNHRFHTIIL